MRESGGEGMIYNGREKEQYEIERVTYCTTTERERD